MSAIDWKIKYDAMCKRHCIERLRIIRELRKHNWEARDYGSIKVLYSPALILAEKNGSLILDDKGYPTSPGWENDYIYLDQLACIYLIY
jgi:hypothetical protein